MPGKKCQKQSGLPEQIRVSLGTAIVLELLRGKLDAEPTTAYLMTYKDGKCSANCSFCPQARGSKSKIELLSRVSWPTFLTINVLTAIGTTARQGKIKRVCIQALNYTSVFAHLEALVREIKKQSTVPVSVSCQPLNAFNIKLLAKAGVDRLGIPLDTATEALFDKIKGKGTGSSYDWENQFCLLAEALSVFGEGNVSTHLIVGLGETEKEAAKIIQKCIDMRVLTGLFAFTPISGTILENNFQPPLESYRRVQLLRFLMANGLVRYEDMHFTNDGKITNFGIASKGLKRIIKDGTPFLTCGCPDCNRPFYNEKPSGPIYNYPRKISQVEIKKIEKQLKFY
ncbi:MAG: radical SAM protein [Candidatus Bathyarchaeia archaeon]